MALVMRLFDVVVSAVVLVLSSWLFLGIAIIIKLDSPGPVFFLQERVGRNWRRFRMFKFRKMRDDVGTSGPSLTTRYDTRVTRVGGLLERTKLDELPQFINVLLGNMSLVVPRPQIAKFVVPQHKEMWDKIFRVKPGIFGPNQITHRNESLMLPDDCDDLEAYFIEHVMPPKLAVDVEYVAKKSLVGDIGLMLRGLWVCLAGAITMDTVKTRRWQVLYLACSVLLGEVTLAAAFFLRFNWRIPADRVQYLYYGLVLMGAARLICFFQLKIHRGVHAYFTLSDAVRICWAVAVGTVLGIAMQILFDIRALSRSIFVVDGVLLALSLVGASYMIDRALFLMERNRGKELLQFPAHVLWGCVAGAAGVVSMLYALSFVWPRVFLDYGFELSNVLLATFLVRLALFPFLVYRLPRQHDFVATVTQDSRRIVRHLALVFIADITVAFFLNIRSYSRAAVIINALFYSLLVVLILAVRCMWNRKHREEPSERHSPGVGKPSRILVVGDGREVGLLISAIRHSGNGRMEAVGIVTEDPGRRTRRVEDVEVLGAAQNLPVLIQRTRPSLVIVLKNTISYRAFRLAVRACRNAGVDMRLVPSITQLVAAPDVTHEEAAPAKVRQLQSATGDT